MYIVTEDFRLEGSTNVICSSNLELVEQIVYWLNHYDIDILCSYSYHEILEK